MKRFFFWGPALAASFLVAFAIYHFSGPQKLNAETLVNQSVQIHRKVMDGDLPSQIPIDIRHNFQKTRAFLSEKVNLNICDHNLAKLGYAHREGCLARCNIAPDRQMATIIYYKGPSRISHFIIRDPSVSFPTNSFRQIKGTNSHYHYFIVRPYKVIVFKNGRTLCLFVGSMSRRHVSELAEFAAREMAS
jgi:hypothetical protein